MKRDPGVGKGSTRGIYICAPGPVRQEAPVVEKAAIDISRSTMIVIWIVYSMSETFPFTAICAAIALDMLEIERKP